MASRNGDNKSDSDSASGPLASPSRRRRFVGVIAGVLLILVVAAGGLWWFLRDDAPARVNLQRAAQSVTTVDGQDQATLDGTWNVNTTLGSFDFESATGTFAGFRVHENLSGIGSTTAVGRTGSVSGSMAITDNTVSKASFTVDLTTITTDRSQRDRRVQEALDTSRFPQATFALTSPISLPANAAAGDDIAVDAKGDLTIHGTTKPVTIALQAKLSGDTIVVVGSVDLVFSDFGVEAPSAPAVLSVDDHGTMELQLLLDKR